MSPKTNAVSHPPGTSTIVRPRPPQSTNCSRSPSTLACCADSDCTSSPLDKTTSQPSTTAQANLRISGFLDQTTPVKYQAA